MIGFFRERWTQILTVAGLVLLIGMVGGVVVGSVLALKYDVTDDTWLIIWTAVYAAFTVFVTMVLFAAALAAVHQLVEAQTARKVQILTDLSRRWDDLVLSESRRKVNTFIGDPERLSRTLKRLDKKNRADYYVIIRVANFFEDLAILVGEDALSLELVKNSLGGPIRHYWSLFRCYILAAQEESPADFEHFARLARDLKED